jgi:hypothetical protein
LNCLNNIDVDAVYAATVAVALRDADGAIEHV